MKTYEIVMQTGRPVSVAADTYEEHAGMVTFLRGGEPVGLLAPGTWQTIFSAVSAETDADRPDDGA